MRKRADLGFSPQWEGPVKGWARKFITKNKWRCDHIWSFEDLMQDAFVIYLKIVDHYPGVREPAHFMALYQTALRNEMHNQSRKMYARNEGSLDTCQVSIPDHSNFGYVAAALAEAPEELKLALAMGDDKMEEVLRELLS